MYDKNIQSVLNIHGRKEISQKQRNLVGKFYENIIAKLYPSNCVQMLY